MRRRLLLVTLAVTTLLVAAFAVPLALLVRDVARDRAITDAERDMATLVPVLSARQDPAVLDAAIQRTAAGADGRLGVWLPDGSRLGDQRSADAADVRLASERMVAFSREHGGAVDVYTPVAVGEDAAIVVRVHIPQRLLHEGVGTSWAILALLAAGLLVVAVAVTDRLARTVTQPAAELAATSRSLAAGELSARAPVSGPPEIADVGSAINLLADRIHELLAAERERVADLSHRLRTPLTALRMDAEASGSAALAADVDRLEAEVTELIRSARRPLHESVQVACDLAAVARSRAEFWGALADDDGRRWTCAVPAGPHLVRLTEDDAAAALDALIGNVFAHTPEGTGYGVSLSRSEELVVLAVEDSGPGIPDPTVVGRGQSAAGSTGLGLDIAGRAATAAGGSMEVGRSALGGARVALELPLVQRP